MCLIGESLRARARNARQPTRDGVGRLEGQSIGKVVSVREGDGYARAEKYQRRHDHQEGNNSCGHCGGGSRVSGAEGHYASRGAHAKPAGWAAFHH
jgi:hypothetical protein